MLKSLSLFNIHKLNFLLLIFLPISLLIGTLISEITIVLIVINFLIYSYLNKYWGWTKTVEFKIRWFHPLSWGSNDRYEFQTT